MYFVRYKNKTKTRAIKKYKKIFNIKEIQK